MNILNICFKCKSITYSVVGSSDIKWTRYLCILAGRSIKIYFGAPKYAFNMSKGYILQHILRHRHATINALAHQNVFWHMYNFWQNFKVFWKNSLHRDHIVFFPQQRRAHFKCCCEYNGGIVFVFSWSVEIDNQWVWTLDLSETAPSGPA